MRKFTVTEAGTSTSTVTSVSVQPSLADTDSELKVCKDRICVLETYIRDTANALLDEVNISTDYVAQDEREYELVTRNKHRSQATQTETVVSPGCSGFCGYWAHNKFTIVGTIVIPYPRRILIKPFATFGHQRYAVGTQAHTAVDKWAGSC